MLVVWQQDSSRNLSNSTHPIFSRHQGRRGERPHRFVPVGLVFWTQHRLRKFLWNFLLNLLLVHMMLLAKRTCSHLDAGLTKLS